MQADGARADRIAQNDATFREANERIAKAADEYAVPAAVPFICECADPGCTQVFRVEIEEYQRVRENPRRFLVVPGHEGSAGGAGDVVEKHGEWFVVEKVGRAGDVAEAEAGR